MCRAMEEMRNETVRERNIEIAKTMLASKKLSYEDKSFCISSCAARSTPEMEFHAYKSVGL